MKHSHAEYVPALKALSDETRLNYITNDKEDCVCKKSKNGDCCND